MYIETFSFLYKSTMVRILCDGYVIGCVNKKNYKSQYVEFQEIDCVTVM